MNKIYQKNELLFTLGWILVYVIGTSLTDSLSKWITVLFHFSLGFILLHFICENDLFVKYGLCKSRVSKKECLYYLPLLLLVSVNLWFGITLNLSLLDSIAYVLSMLCVGFLEEMIF